jgi:PAS domain S-box-containing protein
LLYLIGQGRQDVIRAQQQVAIGEALAHNAAKVRRVVEVLRQDVLFLSSTPPVSGIIRASFNHGFDTRENSPQNRWELRLQEIFAGFSRAHPDYYQIRYIGVADGGREIVRVNNVDGRIKVAQADELQVQGEQNYFRAALDLGPNEVYISEITLNREWGRVELPHRPTLRAVAPIHAPSGKLFGLLVIHMAASDLLAAVTDSLPAGTRTYLANMRGDYLLHPLSERTFGFDLGREYKATQEFPELAELFQPETLQSTLAKTGADLPATRIHFDSAQPGHFLVLAYDTPEEAMSGQIFAALDRRTAIGGAISILLAGLGVWFVLWRVFRPLSRLTQTAKEIAKRGRSVSFPRVEQGEVGDLIQAIRSMLDSIDVREREMRIAACAFETQEAIMITDAMPRILRVNKAFSEITGYASDEVLWMDPRVLSPERMDTVFHDEMWATVLRTGKWSGELWGKRRDGSSFPRWQTITAVLDEEGSVTHYVSIFSDISERVRSESEVRQLASELKRHNEVLQSYKVGIEEEREIARNLLQQFSALDTINDPLVRFLMKPMDEFSGDLVAAARTPDGRLHLLLADGTGHGLNAALSVAPLAQLFYQMTRKGFDIKGIAIEMNQRVRSYLPLPRFVAAALVSVEAGAGSSGRGTIRVWNGGCPAVTLFQSNGTVRHRFESRHLPMGILTREKFESAVEYLEYQSPAQLLLCSDGVTELQTPDGKQLEQTGRLYRAVENVKRFDSLAGSIDWALQGNLPPDDISLLLADCPAPQVLTDSGSAPGSLIRAPGGDQEQQDWSFSLTLTASQLKRLDVVPFLLNVVAQCEEARIEGKLFVILAELFNNSLDHGLLKLDSKLKNGPNGMELYFEERAVRLADLAQGFIEIRLEKILYSEASAMRISFRDSGAGFDYAKLDIRNSQAKHGRGISLLSHLCSEVEYRGSGAEVVALLEIS